MNPVLLEWSAVGFSVLGVWLMAQRRMLAWPVGLVSVGLYALVFVQVRLYSDALLQARSPGSCCMAGSPGAGSCSTTAGS